MHLICKNGHIRNITKCCIKLLTLLPLEKAHTEYMLSKSMDIYIQIIIPLLRVTPEEIESISDNPHEFVNASIDICTEFESESIKTETSLLLLSIMRNVDGMQTFMIDFALKILFNCVYSVNPECKQLLNTVIQNFGLTIKSEEEFIEVALVLLTIMSNDMHARLDLKTMIDEKMMIVIPEILNFPNPILGEREEPTAPQKFSTPLTQQRMIMCISQYFQNLFSTLKSQVQAEDMLDKIVCWLFQKIAEDNGD